MPPALPSGHSLPSGHNTSPSGHNAVDAGPLLIPLLCLKGSQCLSTAIQNDQCPRVPKVYRSTQTSARAKREERREKTIGRRRKRDERIEKRQERNKKHNKLWPSLRWAVDAILGLQAVDAILDSVPRNQSNRQNLLSTASFTT